MTNRRFTIDANKTPDLAAMMLATVEALRKLGGSATRHELDQEVIDQEGVTDDEQSFMMKGRNRNLPRVNYYLAWARTYLKGGEALENPAGGVWALTSIGKKISELDQTRTLYDEIKQKTSRPAQMNGPAAKAGKLDDNESANDDPEDQSWKSELLEVLLTIPYDAFERLAQRLLRVAGFSEVKVMGKVGDQGIDGVGVMPVNLVSIRVYFQCKRWKGKVPNKEIRDFRGALQGRGDKGLFITTGVFTNKAREEAIREGAIAIDLIDGNRLCDLLKEYGLGVIKREQVQIRSDWFEAI